MSLVTPYLGDPGDPSVVFDWRRKAPRLESARLFAERHDRAVETLAGYLKDHDLFVLFPKRMTSLEEKNIERRNDELYSLYRRLREGVRGRSRRWRMRRRRAGTARRGRGRSWGRVRRGADARRRGDAAPDVFPELRAEGF
jgi:hypothetical protein